MERNLEMNWGTDSQEFEHYVGRKPTREELTEFARLLKKGVENQVDWEILCEVASEDFKEVNKNGKSI